VYLILMDVQPEKRKDIDAAVHSRQKTDSWQTSDMLRYLWHLALDLF